MTSHVLMRRMTRLTLLTAVFAAWSILPLYADDAPKPFLHPLFTDNMVLQRGMADPVWGWTTPGQTVTVTLNGQTATAVAGPDGKWTAKIGPLAAGGPYTLSVTGPQAVTLKNVMVGDVWLCSGQSNMEFGVDNLLHPEQTVAEANHPNLRLFTVPKDLAMTPQAVTSGQWQPCSPETIKSQGTWSGFSAVAYFFGRDLQQNTQVPIGLLLSSVGGTNAEAWTDADALRQNVPEFDPQLDQLAAGQGETRSQDQQVKDWYAKNDPGTTAGWQNPALDASDWKKIALPGLFQDAGIPELSSINGVVWFRQTFDLPAGDTGKAAILHLLADDNDTTWVNGTQVGATEGFNTPRVYPVAAGLLKPTGNVVAVRVLDTGGKGGIWGDPAGLSLEFPGGKNLPLAGSWQYHIGVPLTQAAPLPAQIAGNANFPTVLYNGMINPLASFGIKGAIWYQGENNAGNSPQYRRLLPALIGGWRQQWGEGDFPFLIVQLAGWQPGDKDESWANLRQAQWLTARNVPNSGIATAIDIGNDQDIHPKNKQEVGRRLALLAEAKVYGEKVAYAGPVYESMRVTGSTARLTFTHVDGALVSHSGESLTGFAVAGADGKFVPAKARIHGSAVLVSSPKVPHPTAVRYAWSGFPECSLYNKADLPAFPFDTSGK